MNNGAVKISSAGATIILETDFELTVSYDAESGVQVKVPAAYADQVCGLCGNFNRLAEDDHGKPDGSRAANPAELARSWQSDEGYCEASFPTERCPLAEEAKYESESFCGVILSRESPFAGCSPTVTPEAFFRSCVFEMCAAGGDPQALCDVLQTYAEACQAAGISLPPWRNTTVCRTLLTFSVIPLFISSAKNFLDAKHLIHLACNSLTRIFTHPHLAG